MDKIKTVKIKNPDGSISEETYTISVDAKDVDMENGKDLQDTIGTINVDIDGNISEQLQNLKENKVNITDIVDNTNSIEVNKVLSANQGRLLNRELNKKAYYFNTVAAMKDAILKEGDYVCTLGYYTVNDGGAAEYRIVTNTDNYKETLDNGLFAELIIKDIIDVKQFGAYGDGTHDDLAFINNALNYIKANQILYFSEGIYKISNVITISKSIVIKGNGTIKLGGAGFNAMTITANKTIVDGLTFNNIDNVSPSTVSSGDIGDAIRIKASECIVKNCNIVNFIAGIVFGVVGSNAYNKCTIINNNIKIKGLNTGYINDGICSLGDNAIIKNNIITNYDDVKNRGCIVCDINALNNLVENNICECNGVCGVGVHSEQSANTIIRGNNIYNPKYLGVTISTGSIVSKNYIETPHSEVSGYTLDHCAISLYGGPKNCIVDGNLINCFLDSKYAIRGNGNTSGTKIINNSIYSSDNHTPSMAIYMHLAQDTIIANNSIMVTCSTGIEVNTQGNSIIGNVVSNTTTRGIYIAEAENTLVEGNRVINTVTGIDGYNATNSNIIGNLIGNKNTAITTGIKTRNTGGNKYVNCADNNFINVTTEYDRSTYGGLALIKHKDEIDVLDTTLGTRKKIKVDNGSIVVS